MGELLRRFLPPYRARAAGGVAAKVVEVVFDLLTPVIVARMVDVGVATHDVHATLMLGLLLVALAAVGYCFTLICQWQAAWVSQGMGTDLRDALFAKANELSGPELDRLGTSALVTRISSDVNQVQVSVALGIRQLVRWPFLAVGSVVAALLIDSQLGLVFLVCTPAIGLVFWLVMSRAVPLFRTIQLHLDHLARITRESLSGVRVIRAFGREGLEEERFGGEADEQMAAANLVGRLSAALNPATFLIMNLGIVAILWQGGQRVAIGSLTQGEVIAFVNYMTQTLLAVAYVANLVVTFTRGSASAARIMEVLELEPSVRDPEPFVTPAFSGETLSTLAAPALDGEPPAAPPVSTHEKQLATPVAPTYDEKRLTTPAESALEGESLATPAAPALDGEASVPLLELDQVSFSYAEGAADALHDVSLSLGEGQRLGIIGGTGSGKSTLAALLVRLYDPREGTVRIAGRDARTYPLAELHRVVALVPQSASLVSGALRDNLRWRKEDATDEELWRALETAQAADFVREKEGGLDERVEAGGRNFSGGQRQRLTIARALVGSPRLLVLDDAASALDMATDAHLRQAIAKLKGTSAVIISQRAAAVMHCELICVLRHGDVAGLGTHEELMRDCELYREIVDSQLSGEEVRG